MRHSRLVSTPSHCARQPADPTSTGGLVTTTLWYWDPAWPKVQPQHHPVVPATTSPRVLATTTLWCWDPASPRVPATTSPRGPSNNITQGPGHNNLMMLGPYITQGPSRNITQGSQPQHHPGSWPQQPYDAGTLHHPGSQPQHHPGVPATTSPRGPSNNITQGPGHNNLMMLGPYITQVLSHNITQGSQPQHHPGSWPQQPYDTGTNITKEFGSHQHQRLWATKTPRNLDPNITWGLGHNNLVILGPNITWGLGYNNARYLGYAITNIWGNQYILVKVSLKPMVCCLRVNHSLLSHLYHDNARSFNDLWLTRVSLLNRIHQHGQKLKNMERHPAKLKTHETSTPS